MSFSHQTSELNRFSHVPLHKQLSDILITRIRSEGDAKIDKLPSETELVNEFDVSRHVIRQALTNLRVQGLITTSQGRGSYILRRQIEKPLDILQSYHESMKQLGFSVVVKLIKKEIVKSNPEVKGKLQSSENELFYLERISYLDDQPITLLSSFIIPGSWGFDKLMAFASGSLTEHLHRFCGVTLAKATNCIEIRFAQPQISKKLNLDLGSPLLHVDSISYDENNVPIEYTQITYPGTSVILKFDSFKPKLV